MLKTLSLLGMMAGATSGFGTLCGSNAATRKAAPLEFPAASEVPPNLKVVFLGDAGSGNEQRQVLTMAKEWGAEAIVHSGDFEYKNDPDLFEEQLNAVLGPNYPYFASIGNHDLWKWSGHEQKLKARLQNSGYASNCTGEIGVNMACNIKGLYVVLSGVGTRGDDHEEFMDEAFGSSEAIWKVASWHKNQRKMQIGGKFDETGWEVYDLARKHGAIIATGHEHSYCRSHIMSDMEDQVIVNTNSTLNVREGETFVFVSGLGGKEVRDWNDKLVENPWWAAVGASDNGILDGALFCTFNVNGESRLANCFFRDTSGKVWDNFDIVNHNADSREVARARRAAVEARRPACRSRWVEVPVSSALGDALENHETGELICDAKIASFSSKATASFRFENLPLSARSKVLQAHLQVYGAATDGSAGADFVISASRGLPASASCQRELFAPASAPSSSVSWEQEDEEWEDYNVWVSPDLGQLVSEVVGQSGWSKGDTLLLQMTGQNGKEFFAFDTSACVAPTLAIEVLTC